MYVARIPNRGSPPAILLRESYREGGKVRNRTLANLSRWPEEKTDALSRVLKGLPPQAAPEGAFEIVRSLPHGHGPPGSGRRFLLQGALQRRAGLPGLQHRLGHPPDPPSDRRAGPHARVLAHALLLRDLAHEQPPGPDAVHRRRRGGTHEPGRPRSPLAEGAQQDPHQADGRRPAGPQLHQPARRPRHDLLEQDRADRAWPAAVQRHHDADADPAPSVRAPRGITPPRRHVVRMPAPNNANEQVEAVLVAAARGNFGLDPMPFG